LLTAWNRPESLRWIGEGEFAGRKQRVISFADSDGAQVSIYFDATTNLPTKTETLNDDQILGDIMNETVYSDWRAVEKIMLPFQANASVTVAITPTSLVTMKVKVSAMGAIKEVTEVLSVVPLAEVESLQVKRFGLTGVMEIKAGGGSFKLEGKPGDMKELAEVFERAKAAHPTPL